MLTKLVLASLIVVGALGCPSDEDDAAAQAPKPGAALGDGPWDPETCSPVAQQSQGQIPASCTQADIDKYYDCMSTACEGTLRTCYGADFRSGSYGGACEVLIECAVDCTCSDSKCFEKCPGAQTCADCFNAHPCGGDCRIPSCAYAGTGLDATKDCKSLKACCDSLVDKQRTTCQELLMNGLMGMSSADLLCSTSFSFGASLGWKTPQCAK